MSASKQPTIVPREFAADFELVAAHYCLAERGELDVAKEAARADLDSAIVTYAALAAEIGGRR